MLHAVIKKGTDTLHLGLPTSTLYFELFEFGILREPADIRLTDHAGDEIRTRLLADDSMWENFAKLCGETDTLPEINSAAYLLASAQGSIKEKLTEGLQNGEYSSLPDFLGKMEQYYPHTANFYCPLTLKMCEEGENEIMEISDAYLEDYENQIRALVGNRNKQENMEMFIDNAAFMDKVYTID